MISLPPRSPDLYPETFCDEWFHIITTQGGVATFSALLSLLSTPILFSIVLNNSHISLPVCGWAPACELLSRQNPAKELDELASELGRILSLYLMVYLIYFRTDHKFAKSVRKKLDSVVRQIASIRLRWGSKIAVKRPFSFCMGRAGGARGGLVLKH